MMPPPTVLLFVFLALFCFSWRVSSSDLDNSAHKERFQHGHALSPRDLRPKELSSRLRGGSSVPQRASNHRKAWETAVRRGKGGFPSPMSWAPMDEEELRIKAENLLAAEVRGLVLRTLYARGAQIQIPDPVIEQFVPTRAVLWRKWRGTMLEETWGATLLNMAASLLVCVACQRLQGFHPRLADQLHKIDIIWKIHMTLTTFILTFFVSQSYDMWRGVYKSSRHVQGRLYNLLMLTTTHMRRDRRPCPEDSVVSPPPPSAATADGGGSGSGDVREPLSAGEAEEIGACKRAGAVTSVGEVGERTRGEEVRTRHRSRSYAEDAGISVKCGEVRAVCRAGIACGDRVTGDGEAAAVISSAPPSSPPSSSIAHCGSEEMILNSSSSSSDGVGCDSRSLPHSSSMLDEDRMWLAQFERYTRLWHILYYAGCSRKHACFCTDSGLERLSRCGLIVEAELQLLQDFPGPVAHRHMPVFQWMVAFYLKAMEKGRFLQPASFNTRVMEQFVALRDKYGGVGDMVGGRTKLAYAHAVQLLVDVLLILTPFALFSEVGFWSIVASGVLTTFYQGLFNLSKTFIDPLNNEDATIDSDCIIIDSLVKECANMGSRWIAGATVFPF